MASAAQPNPAGGQPGQPAGGQPGGGQDSGQNAQVSQVMDKFRPLAEAVRQLGRQFPEGQEEAVAILKAVQSWMTKVAGNPQRTKEAAAPPNA